MTGRYKAYPEYKSVDANITIPVGWNYCQAKRYLTVQSGDMLPAARVRDSGTPVVGGNGYRGFTDSANTKANTIVIGRVGAKCGCVHTIKEDFWASEHAFKVISRKQYNISFMAYLLESLNLNQYAITTAQPLLNTEIVTSKYISLPNNLIEQQKIANFLDHETAKIDTLIAKQEKLIELLKEKRHAVISHAVTKGLSPNAPMKDSGVEWLGEVPEHWDVLPTKRFFRLVAEPSTKNHNKELLSVYAAIGVAPRKELEQKGNKASNTDGYWLVQKGDIIVNKLLAWMGAVGYSDYDGVTSPAYDILRKTKDINPKFYHYLFRQEFTQKEFKRWSRGIMEMRLRLYFEELGRIMMPMPPKEEQNAIVDEIEAMNSMFSKIEDKARFQIELLTERKTALISAAVTGKIDVRYWDAQGVQG
ncbi:TPA: restriction endonuclease subunit S [Vibrio vulnificus]|nr:restriction endonuclease subunit S [Vibrio vulnificus]